jgi:outer membrane protein TolC
MMTVRATVTVVLIAGLLAGCSRGRYRTRADVETYAVIREKTAGHSWDPSTDFSIESLPRSRLTPAGDPDAPELPAAKPKLYSYEIQLVSAREGEVPAGREGEAPAEQARGSAGSAPSQSSSKLLVPPPQAETEFETTLPIRPISKSAWNAVSRECLARMLEFAAVRDEYRRSFGSEPTPEQTDPAPRLTLEEIVRLGLLNSREYQTQKEALYRAALALTLQRFDYELKFSPTGNGTGLDFLHKRTDGVTEHSLTVPSQSNAEKMLATGGDFLARFANDVVLTFNGPDGFAADISSELFFKMTQPILQRDIRFEPLIQAERNVIYAAREFARFRKRFFFDRASDYYALLRRYRQIEIESQNYFSLVRALSQAEAEELAGIQSRIQVEQIEQQMLGGRRRLSTACNSLESSLDRLKIAMGLPTEQPINLALHELDELTLRDEAQVAAERAGRARRRLEAQRAKAAPDRAELLNASIVFTERLNEWLRLRTRLGEQIDLLPKLEDQHLQLRVDEARLAASQARQEMDKAQKSDPPSPPLLVFQRTIDFSDAAIRLVTKQLDVAARLRADPATTTRLSGEIRQLRDASGRLREQLAAAVKESKLERVDALLEDARRLVATVEQHAATADRLTQAPTERPRPEEEMRQTVAQVDQLLGTTDALLRAAASGLAAIEMSMDDAMLTALYGRLDLTNERGRLADDRRLIKYGADDLKSVLNLNAEQTISTKKNRPLDFTWENSQTRVGLTLDLPLNRKAQRNAYRLALINYQASLRSLMQLEDNIKLAVRDELRGLALARDQYLISVASGALAAERVLSTRLELALGFPGVAARDFLEAQDAYRDALSAVADQHIDHIVERTRFFLDIELLELDRTGFWPQLHNERLQPTPLREFPADTSHPYGDLPECLRLSEEIRHMADCAE